MEHIKEFIRNLRTDYNLDVLNLESTDPDPVVQFAFWMKQAIDQRVPEPNAMNLSTVKTDGHPSSRIVLLRSFDHEGFVFFTNYESNKGRELDQNPWCALNFFWPELHKQIRIEGPVSRVASWESEDYFRTRPRESQLGSLISRQSSELKSRQELEEKFENLTREFEGSDVDRPAWWGGFRIVPNYYEFWQGRPNRLHDRVAYQKNADSAWRKFLMYP